MANPGTRPLYEPPSVKPSIQLGANDYGKPMGKPLPRPDTRPKPGGIISGWNNKAARRKKFLMDQQGQQYVGGQNPQRPGPQPPSSGPISANGERPLNPQGGNGGINTFPEQQGSVARGSWDDPNYDRNPSRPFNPGVNTVAPSWGPSSGGQGFGKGEMNPGGGLGTWKPDHGDENGGWGGGMNDMKDPRAGGLNKVTGQWTPPDPAYLEGLKNGTIEPEWKRKQRLSVTTNGPGTGVYGGNQITTMPTHPWDPNRPEQGRGGKFDPASYAPPLDPSGQNNAGKPQMAGSPQGAFGGAEAGGAGGDGGGGRQPLRPGMEYRPGGGQRPVGGGRNGGPQAILPNESGQYDPQGMYSETSGPGQEDPQAQMRRKLMQLQQQGPMNNKYYGAF